MQGRVEVRGMELNGVGVFPEKGRVYPQQAGPETVGPEVVPAVLFHV